MKDKEVDARQLMEEVVRVIAEPTAVISDFGIAETPQVFNHDYLYPPHTRSLRINLDLVSRNWEINNEVAIRSKRKHLGWLVVLVKRIVRILTTWYMNPLVHELRQFNMLVTRTLFDISRNISEVRDRLDGLEKAQTELHLRVTEIEEAESTRNGM